MHEAYTLVSKEFLHYDLQHPDRIALFLGFQGSRTVCASRSTVGAYELLRQKILTRNQTANVQGKVDAARQPPAQDAAAAEPGSDPECRPRFD